MGASGLHLSVLRLLIFHMRVALFSTKPYDREFFSRATEAIPGVEFKLSYFETSLGPVAARIGRDFEVVCAFVNDVLDRPTLETLSAGRTRLVAMRCAGFNNVDLRAAEELGIRVVRVPAYSPHAVAEHVFALLLTLVRRTHRAWNRVREGNFSLHGLIGYDLHGKTVGIVGTGRIGAIVAGIFRGFGCEVLAYDLYPNESVQAFARYVMLDQLLASSDIISLHCPLTPQTYHLIDETALGKMKSGVTLINTSRGALIDTNAVYEALKCGKVGHLGLDVYEEEADLFFEDLSDQIIQDDLFMRLTTFPNVLITGHQAFLTDEALTAIAEVTLRNILAFANREELVNEVRWEGVKGS